MISFNNDFNEKQQLNILQNLSKLKQGESIRLLGLKHSAILKNEGFDCEEKQNADIVSGGINPVVALSSLIAGKPYIYHSDRFGKKNGREITINDYIKTQNKIDAVAAGNGGYAGFFDNAYFRLQEEISYFDNIDKVRNLAGGRVGNQIPEVPLVSSSDNPRYAQVMNMPISAKISINQMENQRNIQMFGYNVAEERYNQFLKELAGMGEAQAMLTLFGKPEIGAQGLLNNNGIVELSDDDTSALGFNGNYKSISDIVMSGNEVYKNLFVAKIRSLVMGEMPFGFDNTTSYYGEWKNAGMEDPVLLIPKRDYANIAIVSTANGGAMQYQEDFIARLEREVPGLTVLPSPFIDCSWVNNGGFTIADNDENAYILYDRAKPQTYITSPIGSLKYESTSFAGIQKDISVFGSRTDVFSFEKIFGFKFSVEQ